MMDLKQLLFSIYETPALSRAQYLELREGLPNELKEIIDEAYILDREMDMLKTLFRKLNKGNVMYATKIYERFIRLVSNMLVYYSKYLDEKSYDAFKNEVNKFLKNLWYAMGRVREPSYTITYMICAIKMFIYMFVYIPIKKLKEKFNQIIVNEFAKLVKASFGLLPEPSEVLKETK